MKLDRKKLFRIHGWIGIKLSILFFIVCFSGTLAVLSHEMDWLFNPDTRAQYQEQRASRNSIVQQVKASMPDARIVYWEASREPYLCDQIHVTQDNHRYYVFANPYTGQVQGHASLTIARFLRDLHYYLFIPFQVGHFTVLIFGFLLLASVITALYFYRKWYRKFFALKKGKGPVVLFRSLHRVVGVWSIPLALLFAVTGIWYFIERTNLGQVSTIANTKTPEIQALGLDSVAFAQMDATLDYDQAIAAAKAAIPDLQVKDIFIPTQQDRPLYLTGTNTTPLVRHRANRVYIHPLTYEVVAVQDAGKINTVTWLNDIMDPLHFGYWGGLPSKIIWFLSGLAISGLVLTGIWISLKRKVRDAQKAKHQRLGKWKYANWAVLFLLLLFMYGTLIVRYAAGTGLIIGLTLAIIGLTVLGWYIFVHRIAKSLEKERATKT